MAGAMAEISFGQRSPVPLVILNKLKIKKVIYSGLSDLGVVSSELPTMTLSRTINQIIQEQECIVREYLAANINKLHILAEVLLEQEKLSGQELRGILHQSA